jgi:hypothetical protein
VYRSEKAGDDWIDISAGLLSRFSFPLAVRPHDGNTIYVIPEESDECRLVPGGAFCADRSKNRGDTWEVLTDGPPQVHTFQNVLRTAMTSDAFGPPGIYVGTQGGRSLASRDAGDHWTLLLNRLPPVSSLPGQSSTASCSGEASDYDVGFHGPARR